MCVEIKEQAQAHYFRTILAIPNRIIIQNTDSLARKMHFFLLWVNQNVPDRIPSKLRKHELYIVFYSVLGHQNVP